MKLLIIAIGAISAFAMAEEAVMSGVTSIAQYGALGGVLILSLLTVAYLLRFVMQEIKKVLVDIVDSLSEIRASIERLHNLGAHYDDTISHERGKSDDCYKMIIAAIEEQRRTSMEMHNRTEKHLTAIETKMDGVMSKIGDYARQNEMALNAAIGGK